MSGGTSNTLAAVNPLTFFPQAFNSIKNFGSNFKSETPKPIPAPALTPAPTANDQDPTLTNQQRQKKLAALQYGFASTMTKGSTFGNAQTATPGLKDKLGM